MPKSALAVYMNDHLGMMTAELELARRMVRENEGSPLAQFLSGYAAEVGSQRQLVEQLLDTLGESESLVTQAAGWLLEKAGRLKPNDSWTEYTELSRVVELEALAMAAYARVHFWDALGMVQSAEIGAITADGCVARAAIAREQLVLVEQHHRQAVRRAICQ